MLDRPDDYYAIDQALRADESATLLMRADPQLGAVLDPDEARRALALLPNGYEVEVKGAGHAIHAYKPTEFVDLVTDFVKSRPVQ
jgi:pimeloyl-ACP methyl ester carboxylesterase